MSFFSCQYPVNLKFLCPDLLFDFLFFLFGGGGGGAGVENGKFGLVGAICQSNFFSGCRTFKSKETRLCEEMRIHCTVNHPLLSTAIILPTNGSTSYCESHGIRN